MATPMDSEMPPKLWSELPSDVEGRILSFLTMPVLCRFRAVCRRWDTLIRSSRFRSWCIQNGPAQGYILGRAAKKLEPGKPYFSKSIGWRLLDVKANRWYFIEQDGDDLYDSFKSRTLAMEGGLVCAFYMDQMARCSHDRVTVCVSNPVAKVSARLPALLYDVDATTGRPGPVQVHLPSLMSMVVEHGDDFERYKVFVMSSALRGDWQTPDMVVYDSTTRAWRPSSSNPPRRLVQRCDFSKAVRCTARFQGFLFAVITSLSPLDVDMFCQISVFRPDEDAWCNTSSPFPHPTLLLSPQLIVSGNRLFLLSWVRVFDDRDHVSTTFDIIEIVLDQDGVVWSDFLFGIPEEQMNQQFETVFHERTITYGQYFTESPDVTAFGFEKAIILTARRSGVSKEVDLVTQSLMDLKRPLKAPPCDHDVWYGQPMSIIPHHAMFSRLRKRREVGIIDLQE